MSDRKAWGKKSIGPNRNYVEFLTTASNVIHVHFQVFDSDLHSAVKNHYFQNTTNDVQKPHQAEVFRIVTALQDVQTWSVRHTGYPTDRLAPQRTQYFT